MVCLVFVVFFDGFVGSEMICYLCILLILVNEISLGSTAVVDVNHTSSNPNGLIIIPENLRTSTINVTFNETVQTNSVIVVCSSVESVPGITQVVFTNTTAPVGSGGAIVKYSIVSPGQPTTVQCSAQSNVNHTQQFTLATSKGRPGLLQVTKAPTITICKNPVLVTPDITCQTVQVELSETVGGKFPVIVNCSVIDNTDAGLQIKFEPKIIDTGKRVAKVPYILTVSRGTLSSSVKVICRAQTYNVTRLPTKVVCGKATVPSTTTPPPTTAALPSNITNLTTTTAPLTIPTPAPPPEIVIEQFNRSVVGVDYFQYLSENSVGTPVTFRLNPLTLQLSPQSTSIHDAYSIILALSDPITIPMDVLCSLTLLPAGSINSSHVNCPLNPVGTVTLSPGPIQLKLAKTEIQFQKLEISKTLSISVSGRPVAHVRDLVQLSCCPKDTGFFKPSPVGSFLWVDLERQLPINSDRQTSTASMDIDLTCQCNLKEAQCDAGCCCDQDCSTSERSTFSCVKGFFGGDSEEKPFEFSCQATWPDSTDWQPLLCVTISNSPFVGYWYNYTSPPTAKDLPEYNTLLQAATRTKFSYQQTFAQSSSDGTYKVGTTIKTAANSNDNQYLTASVGTLSLPQRVFSGLCSQSVPVRFLENSESSCVTELTESLCTASSSLSASSYLMSRLMTSPPCPVPAAVLRNGALSQTQNEKPELADIEVQYFCTKDSSQFLSLGNAIPGSASKESALKTWRCAFNDGKTAPPLPVFNSTSNKCFNVVLNVTYQFHSYGQKIAKVIVTVTLGDVPVSAQSYANIATRDSPINTITQLFTAKFIHSSTFNTSSEPLVVSTRSGNPGYVKGRPLLAIRKSGNTSTQAQLPVRSPSADGLCSSSSSTPVLHGESVTTGCLIKLGFDDMRNCSRVRELVRTYQEALLVASHVGRTGNARVIIDEDWLPILRDEIKNVPAIANSWSTGDCTDIPYAQVIEVLVSEAGRYQGVPQVEVVGLKISYRYTTWRFRCISGYGLSCLATSNADTSKIAVTPTVTVSSVVSVSASVNSSVNGSATVNNSTVNNSTVNNSTVVNVTKSNYSPRQMYFLLENSVVFIEIPATEPAKTKRSVDQSGICYEDVCKEELFYPLSPAYQGESKEKVMSYALLLIFMTLVIFACTKPWG